MKRTVLFIISIVLIICVILLSRIYKDNEKNKIIQEFNLKYEKYLNKELIGTDIATIINQAVDNNEQQFVKKDDKGKYIQDENAVNIQVKITDLEDGKTYTMETLYNSGINEFVRYYGQIKFICSKIDYGSNGQVNYMLFEQIK